MPAPPDTLQRFLIESAGVRGEIVHLDAAWRAVVERGDYPDTVRRVLGESFGATALLAASIKLDGTLTVQANGGGPLRLLMVEASGHRTLRAIAHWRGAVEGREGMAALLGRARLAITVDPGEGRDRYQGIVDVQSPSVAGVIEDYFARSEQLPTRLWLAAGENEVAGLLLQQVPGRDAHLLDADERAEGWTRSVTLAETVTEPELLSLDPGALLRRLYHEEVVRVFEPERWGFRCTCSRERVETTLRSLGRDQIESVLEEHGSVEVTCEFCGARYDFDRVDVAGLFIESAHDSVARQM